MGGEKNPPEMENLVLGEGEDRTRMREVKGIRPLGEGRGFKDSGAPREQGKKIAFFPFFLNFFPFPFPK